MCVGTNSNGDTQYEVVTKPPSYWEIPPGKKIVLQLNNLYQPLGLSVGKFRRNCGKLIRNGAFVNMHDKWGSVDLVKRQCLWEALMVCHIHNTLLIFFFFFFFWFFFSSRI
jgi:hypothetical protein